MIDGKAGITLTCTLNLLTPTVYVSQNVYQQISSLRKEWLADKTLTAGRMTVGMARSAGEFRPAEKIQCVKRTLKYTQTKQNLLRAAK